MKDFDTEVRLKAFKFLEPLRTIAAIPANLAALTNWALSFEPFLLSHAFQTSSSCWDHSFSARSLFFIIKSSRACCPYIRPKWEVSLIRLPFFSADRESGQSFGVE